MACRREGIISSSDRRERVDDAPGHGRQPQQFADLVVAELGLESVRHSANTFDTVRKASCRPASKSCTNTIRRPQAFPTSAGLQTRWASCPWSTVRFCLHTPLILEPKISADVPMIIGSTLNEFITAPRTDPEYESMTDDELQQRVKEIYPEKAPQIIEVFRIDRRRRRLRPVVPHWRHACAPVAIAQAAAKVVQGKAPAYLYWFTWQTPVLNGRPRAFHCAELPFVFDNTDRCESMTGGGADARSLAARMSEAWIRFARTGDPNHPGMPRWEPFSGGLEQTMIFDNQTLLVNGPDAAEQKSIAEG